GHSGRRDRPCAPRGEVRSRCPGAGGSREGVSPGSCRAASAATSLLVVLLGEAEDLDQDGAGQGDDLVLLRLGEVTGADLDAAGDVGRDEDVGEEFEALGGGVECELLLFHVSSLRAYGCRGRRRG